MISQTIFFFEEEKPFQTTIFTGSKGQGMLVTDDKTTYTPLRSNMLNSARILWWYNYLGGFIEPTDNRSMILVIYVFNILSMNCMNLYTNSISFYFQLNPAHVYQFSSVTQLCPTLCNPMNCSTPGLPVGEGSGTPLQYSCLENPRTEESGRLQSMGSLRVGHE